MDRGLNSMKTYTHRQYVEIFHLLFLSQLSRKLDKKEYTLKGGCNLRFFFRSPRYSEDIDLDVGKIPVHILQEKVDGILKSTAFRQILEVRGVGIEHVTEHKQTDTTQRWKLGLRVNGVETPLPTKIEFSRRGIVAPPTFESVDPSIIRSYELVPVMTNHYPREIAFRQKIEALVTRSAPQARDIFDLHLLHSSGAEGDLLKGQTRERLEEARAKALAMSFEEFKSQVVAYLLPDDQAQYGSEATWDSIRLEVVEALSGGAR
jgi:predicted nucleotidyltransferase component of viral defense system